MQCEEPTLHTRTAIAIAETLLPDAKFTVTVLQQGGRQLQQQFQAPPLWLIHCQGAGVVRQGPSKRAKDGSH